MKKGVQPGAEASGPLIGPESITGVILAGGEAQRMQVGWEADSPGRHPSMVPDSLTTWQGVDKGLLLLDGKPLIGHACEFIRPQVVRLLISANRYLDLYARYGEVIPDDPAPAGRTQGPLAGISSVLSHVGTPWLAVLPVDVLCPPMNLLPRLTTALAAHTGALAAFASTGTAAGGRDHPLCLVLHVSLRDDLRLRLQRNERKVMSWLQDIDALRVEFDPTPRAFENINTPEALRVACQGRGPG